MTYCAPVGGKNEMIVETKWRIIVAVYKLELSRVECKDEALDGGKTKHLQCRIFLRTKVKIQIQVKDRRMNCKTRLDAFLQLALNILSLFLTTLIAICIKCHYMPLWTLPCNLYFKRLCHELWASLLLFREARKDPKYFFLLFWSN